MSFVNQRRREQKGVTRSNTEMGTVTSPGEEIAAMGAGEYRGITLIAPFGINWNPPADENIQLIKNLNNPNNINGIGCPVNKKINPGEIEIYTKDSSIFLKDDGTISMTAKGGASIILEDDGSVLINNHLKINSDGTTVII